MNTTLKGDIFEKRVFDLINDLLKNEEYFLSGKNSKIFSKKKSIQNNKKQRNLKSMTWVLAYVTYLPKFKGKSNYLFVAIDRCTRAMIYWVYENKTSENTDDFMGRCLAFFGSH